MSGTEAQQRHALVIDANLMTAVRLERGLQALGYTVSSITPAQAREWNTSFDLAAIHYGIAREEALQTTRILRGICPSGAILGYVSHGMVPELRPLAREAGCSLLVANSAMAARLPQLAVRLERQETEPQAEDEEE